MIWVCYLLLYCIVIKHFGIISSCPGDVSLWPFPRLYRVWYHKDVYFVVFLICPLDKLRFYLLQMHMLSTLHKSPMFHWILFSLFYELSTFLLISMDSYAFYLILLTFMKYWKYNFLICFTFSLVLIFMTNIINKIS